MDNKNEIKRTPRPRIGGGPGMGHGPAEKAKDFKGAIKRLFGELRKFRVLIIVALVLATLGAILSISAPDRLSDLTDEISKGIMTQFMDIEKIKKIAIFLAGLYITTKIF